MKRLIFLVVVVLFSNLDALPYYIEESEIQMLRENPENIYSSYLNHQKELRLLLGEEFEDLNDQEIYLIHCSLVAHGMAPYGKYCGKTSIENLLTSPFLHCASYPLLTVLLAEIGRDISDLFVPEIGVYGEAMGGHGFLFLIRKDHRDVFIDPTSAIIIRVSFDDFFSGKRIKKSKIKDFGFRDDTVEFRHRLYKACINGLLRPSELIFFFKDVHTRLRVLPLSESTATPAYHILYSGPSDYLFTY